MSMRRELARLRTHLQARQPPPPESPRCPLADDDWEAWLTTLFRRYFTDATGWLIPFAPHHAEFWQWVWAIRRGERPRPFIGIWARGGGKSTDVELSCVMMGALKTRKYALYVSGTQEQSDDHVQNIATMLESPEVARYYPQLASRMVGKYGASRG